MKDGPDGMNVLLLCHLCHQLLLTAKGLNILSKCGFMAAQILDWSGGDVSPTAIGHTPFPLYFEVL